MKIKQIKNIQIQAANNRLTLLDVYFPKIAAKLPILIFAHGFKGYKDWGQFPLMLEKAASEGFCVLAFNFSHNGGTVEQPIDFPDLDAFSKNTYSKEQEDLKCVVDWCFSADGKQLLPACDLTNINLWGHSRGGSMVLLYASTDSRINKVISWSAVADLISRLPEAKELNKWKEEGVTYVLNGRTKQQMPQSYTFVENILANQDQFDLKKAVEKLGKRQLIIHGKEDETVAITDAEQLKKWNPQAGLKLIPKAGHTFGGKQPFDSAELPNETWEALECSCLFLKET